MKFINVSIYWHRTGGIINCLNRLLRAVLCCAPTIILATLFGKIKIFLLLEELPQKILYQNENMHSKLIRVLVLLIWTINLMA